MRKTFTIVGATSDIGKVVVEQLEDMGYTVRKVSRTSRISIDNEKALRDVFSGADGAYLVIPFDMQAPDLHKREDEIGRKLAEAVKRAGVKRVVFLSALAAHLNKTSGLKTSAWGAGIMEDRLDKLNIDELIHLHCGFFMETANSFNNKDAWALEKRSPENTTQTTLEQWAQEVLQKAFSEQVRIAA